MSYLDGDSEAPPPLHTQAPSPGNDGWAGVSDRGTAFSSHRADGGTSAMAQAAYHTLPTPLSVAGANVLPFSTSPDATTHAATSAHAGVIARLNDTVGDVDTCPPAPVDVIAKLMASMTSIQPLYPPGHALHPVQQSSAFLTVAEVRGLWVLCIS